MSSPNPFNVACTTGPAVNRGFVRYADVSPSLGIVTYCRGGYKFRLHPYSYLHAYMTGHEGTPTRTHNEWERLENADRELESPDWAEPKDHSSCQPAPLRGLQSIVPKLLPSPGDVPQGLRLRSLGHGALETRDDPRSSELEVSLLDNTDEPPQAQSSDLPEGNPPLGSENWMGIGLEVHDANNPNLAGELGSPLPDYRTASAEVGHRRRSPYYLRVRKRNVIARMEDQARAIGLPLDDVLLKEAGVRGYNPSSVPIRNIRLLYTLGSVLSLGITIKQYGKIFRRCMRCSCYIFGDWMKKHDCHGPVIDTTREDFCLTTELLRDGARGLTIGDVKSIFSVCDTCRRMYMGRYNMHGCPLGPGDDELVEDGLED